MRFPGFEGEWKETKFGEIATNKSLKFNPEKSTASIKCIELEHISGDNGELLGFIDGSQSGSIKNVFSEGDVLFGKLRPYLRKYLQAPFDGVCSSEIWVLKGKIVTNSFLYQIVQTDKFIDLANQSSGSKMPRADWNVVIDGVFSVPTSDEQEKISKFLVKLDERIQTQNKIIKELNVLKTTITKGIFSGQLRFKDENKNDFPDWEEKKLREIANIKSGLSKDQNGNSYGYKVTRIETISDSTINVTKVGYIAFDGNIDDYKIKKGDILFSNINSVSHIGKTAIAYSDLDLYHGMNLLCIKSKYELNPLFLYYYFNTVKIRDYFRSICNQAVSQASINQTELGKTIIVLPRLKEQTKIANFLYSIYSKIDIEIQVLQKIEKQKKYLLANLFI